MKMPYPKTVDNTFVNYKVYLLNFAKTIIRLPNSSFVFERKCVLSIISDFIQQLTIRMRTFVTGINLRKEDIIAMVAIQVSLSLSPKREQIICV